MNTLFQYSGSVIFFKLIFDILIYLLYFKLTESENKEVPYYVKMLFKFIAYFIFKNF
jgi:hypothetical protein